MASVIISNHKTIRSIRQEFSKEFPYLSLQFTKCSLDKTIKDIRQEEFFKDITINSNMNLKELEQVLKNEFKDPIFIGCITKNDIYHYDYIFRMTNTSVCIEYDKIKLYQLNKLSEEQGFLIALECQIFENAQEAFINSFGY